ncbi:MAG TPA: branched-chain amino acid ABC transporter permease [Atribacterota bacterium]|nr:branched-chain amino acid ABC transporter permease [Atribacterota bacterium]HOR42452.1 branched-chain amino acid ABC transporter permease [Atribacterota bacterium]
MFLYLLQQLVNAISYGSILGLLAVGYTMIYGILGLINFAHGEIFMIGAFTCYLYVKFLKIPWFIAALLAITTSVIAGLLLEKIAYRPSIKKGSSVLTIFIISFAASMFLRYLFMLFFTDERKAFPIPAFFEKMYFVNGVVIGLRDIIIFTTTIIIMIAISYFVKYSKLGIAMRAVSYDSKTANYMGINSTLIIKTAFVLGSVLAGISGIEYGLSFGIVNPSMGFNPGLTGFIAAVLGGIGNVPGAMVAGFIVGIGEVLFVAMLPSIYSPLRPLFVWVLLFFILFLKPTGLFRPNVKFEGGWGE